MRQEPGHYSAEHLHPPFPEPLLAPLGTHRKGLAVVEAEVGTALEEVQVDVALDEGQTEEAHVGGSSNLDAAQTTHRAAAV